MYENKDEKQPAQDFMYEQQHNVYSITEQQNS